MSPIAKATAHWMKGLFGAIIGGGAGGVTAAVSANLIAPQVFNLGAGLWSIVQLMIATFVINGLLGMFLYLKESPVPPDEQ